MLSRNPTRVLKPGCKEQTHTQLKERELWGLALCRILGWCCLWKGWEEALDILAVHTIPHTMSRLDQPSILADPAGIGYDFPLQITNSDRRLLSGPSSSTTTRAAHLAAAQKLDVTIQKHRHASLKRMKLLALYRKQFTDAVCDVVLYGINRQVHGINPHGRHPKLILMLVKSMINEVLEWWCKGIRVNIVISYWE